MKSENTDNYFTFSQIENVLMTLRLFSCFLTLWIPVYFFFFFFNYFGPFHRQMSRARHCPRCYSITLSKEKVLWSP